MASGSVRAVSCSLSGARFRFGTMFNAELSPLPHPGLTILSGNRIINLPPKGPRFYPQSTRL